MRKKYNELLHIYELISVVGIELFNEISNIQTKTNPVEISSVINNTINNYSNLILYCNNELKKISGTYNNIVVQISNDWKIFEQKFKLSDYNECLKFLYDSNIPYKINKEYSYVVYSKINDKIKISGKYIIDDNRYYYLYKYSEGGFASLHPIN